MRCLQVLLLFPLLAFGAEVQVPEPRGILGGAYTSVEAYPFTVYIDSTSGFCTGSIISPHWVLTAAHCVVGGDGQIIHINDIEHGYASSYGFTSRSVRRIIPHPEYDFSGAGFRNDIALVEVLQPFSQAYSALLAIPSRSVELSTAPTGTLAVAVGYGLKEDNQWNDGMRSVEIELLQPQDCRNRFVLESEIAVVHEDTLCAGKTGQGINSGDSGGPLLVSRSGGGSLSWLQVGVASMRARDASGTPGPSVYTRVSGYAEWIAQTTKQDGSPTPQQRTAAYMLQVTSLLRVNQNNIRALERERDQLLRSLFGLLDQYLATPDQ